MRVLALTPGRPVANATLLDAFWPTSDPAHGGSSLRTAASQIRKVLGSDSVVRVGHGLMLHARVDVADFRALAERVTEARAQGDCERVVTLVDEAEALYQGDIEVTGTDCSLLHDARRDLAALRVHLLLEAAEAAGRCHLWTRSLELARRAAAIERSDRATRALMRAWSGLGEAAKPVEEFERLRRHLAETYGVDPAPQTRTLYLELVGACDVWPPAETVVGRRREIRAAVTAALGWMMEAQTSGGVVWLLGRSGSGREAIAREAAKTVRLLADERAGEAPEPQAQVLSDQPRLTPGTAEMLRRRAAATGLILFVPVDEEARSVLGHRDATVEVPPLEYYEFRRLMSFVLQGTVARRLVDELYAESRGLPGHACRMARSRATAGQLTWRPDGVDDIRRPRRPSPLVRSLAAWPLALLGLFGLEGIGEPSAPLSVVAEERAAISSGGSPAPPLSRLW